MEEVPELNVLKMFYRPFCSEEEIERIFNLKSTEDYLLKARADYVTDHMRIYRVMRRRMNNAGESWSFSEHFEKKLFHKYLDNLNEVDKQTCKNISKGFVFSTDPNGVCANTEFGNVIMLSEALKYFLYFMNLAHLQFEDEVSTGVRIHAQMIALRVMLGSEALDFDLDPRGVIPDLVDEQINVLVEAQLEFVIGHEYAHHILGHLEGSNLIERQLYRTSSQSSEPDIHKIFSYMQQEEFDADTHAISKLDCDRPYKQRMLFGAVTFFSYMDLFQNVKDQISPSSSFVKTHPEPIDRLWNIYNHYGEQFDLDKDIVNSFVEGMKRQKEFLSKDIAVNIESYENYGSVYLAEWRGAELIDRVDYYF
ncbi:hypothetical protein [Moritella marina]|uniref:hypothetical protein n=1 Tax=Moritella marina TaxID=90736 RepID=UPI00370458CB